MAALNVDKISCIHYHWAPNWNFVCNKITTCYILQDCKQFFIHVLHTHAHRQQKKINVKLLREMKLVEKRKLFL